MARVPLRPADLATADEHRDLLAAEVRCIIDAGGDPGELAAELVATAGGILATMYGMTPAQVHARLAEHAAVTELHLIDSTPPTAKVVRLSSARARTK